MFDFLIFLWLEMYVFFYLGELEMLTAAVEVKDSELKLLTEQLNESKKFVEKAGINCCITFITSSISTDVSEAIDLI